MESTEIDEGAVFKRKSVKEHFSYPNKKIFRNKSHDTLLNSNYVNFIPTPAQNPISQYSTYKKVQGTVNLGKEYEFLLCGLCALKLSLNGDVADFQITTNNEEYGAFDDIGLKIQFKNGQEILFLFQVKHKEKSKIIPQKDLSFKFGKCDFYLEKYFTSLGNIKEQNAVCILYTNCSIGVEEKSEFQDMVIEKVLDFLKYEELLDLNQNTSYKLFSKKYQKSFFFCTKQRNIHEIKGTLEKIFQDELKSEMYHSFYHYMCEWCSKNFVLTKHDFIAKLTELALTPYLKPLSEDKYDARSEKLGRAIMQFEMTIVKDDAQIVENIWKVDDLKQDEINETMQKFGVTAESTLQKSKILWYLDKAPLIIDALSLCKIKSVLKFLKRDLKNKKIVLIGNVNRKDFAEWDVFENLANLLEKCESGLGIMDFKISLQGKQEISLQNLKDRDPEICKIFETKELFKLAQVECLKIGQKQKTCGTFLERTLSTGCYNTVEVLNPEHYTSSTIILNCPVDLKKGWELKEFLRSEVENFPDVLFLHCTSKCSLQDFELVKSKSTKDNCYLFEVIDNSKTILLLEDGSKLNFRSCSLLIKQRQIFEIFQNPLNYICAPPGMGKSTLMKTLCYCCPKEFWGMHVDLINYKQLFSKLDYDEILTHLLELNQTQESLEAKMKSILFKNRKIYMFFDGLHEVDSEHINLVINFIKFVSLKGIYVWISARENLKEKICETLHVTPIGMEAFNEEEQKLYVEKRLKDCYSKEQIENIFRAIFKSADLNNSRELLGTPLHLYIVTDIFLNNEEVYRNLDHQNIFRFTEMYKLFFEGRKKSALKKETVDEGKLNKIGWFFEQHLEQYEIPALKSCLEESDFEMLQLDEKPVAKFVEWLKTNGDIYGITSLYENDKIVFTHQTYAEYFACLWFRKNGERTRLWETFIVKKNYENLRKMLDDNIL